MAFLLTFEVIAASGEILETETVVAELPSLETIEKHAEVFGQRLTLRLTFDPPLAPRPKR